MKILYRTIGPLVCAAAALITLLGCENAIDPIADEGQDIYAIYGYLDMRTSLQKVRVDLLRPTILSDPLSLEGVQVTTIDRNDGTFEVWRDSSVVLDDGSQGHLFVAEFRPTLGHVYSLLVSRHGAPGAEAVSELPLRPEVIVDSPVGDSLNVSQHFTLLGVTQKPTAVYVRYEVGPPDDSGVQVIRVAYGDPGSATARGWEFDIDLSTDRYIIMNGLDLNINTKGVTVRRVSMEMTLFSKEWTSKEIDGNLDRAHGFFASVGVFEFAWLLDSDTLNKLGLLNGQVPN